MKRSKMLNPSFMNSLTPKAIILKITSKVKMMVKTKFRISRKSKTYSSKDGYPSNARQIVFKMITIIIELSKRGCWITVMQNLTIAFLLYLDSGFSTLYSFLEKNFCKNVFSLHICLFAPASISTFG